MVDSVAHPVADHEGPTDAGRRDFLYLATGAVGVAGVVAIAWPLIDQLNPAADALALATIEYDLTKVSLGQQVTIAWRKQPVFIRHRTPAEIAAAVADDHAPMKDPATDASRVKPGHAQWLIVIGRLHPPGLRADLRRAANTAAGSAPATARSTTPPAASAKARRR